MVARKVRLIIIIVFAIICMPSFVRADTEYVVALDAGHSLNFEEDKSWWEGLTGDTWKSEWGNQPDYDNTFDGIISGSEAQLTKKTVMYMIEYLKQYDNIKVIVCPRTGKNHYSDRPFYARDNNANIHLSIHYDAPNGPKGPITIYKPNDNVSKKFAELVLESVVDATKLNNRGSGTDLQKCNQSLNIIQPSSKMNGAPSVVLECACFDNDDDLLFISEEANVKKIAAGAVSAILKQLGVKDKGYPDIPDYDGYSGALSGASGSSAITSNEDKFLGLWKNFTGVYEPYYKDDGVEINKDSLYNKDGTEVVYSSYNASVAADIINSSIWFFTLLETSERTQNHIVIMKYLMNVYTDTKDYGDLEFDRDIASLFGNSSNFNEVSGIYGGTIQEKVWFALKDAGFSEIAVAGAMGNIYGESEFNPSLIEGGYTESNGGIGLCQWTNDGRGSTGRNAQLKAYAASKGVDWKDEDTQIEFLLGELTPGGGANGYAEYQLLTYNGYNAESWKNATTPSDAATGFCYSFERPGIPRLEIRQQKAEEYYNEFKGKTKQNVTSSDSRIGNISLSGDNAKKMNEMLAEACRIADDDRYTYSQGNRYGEFQYDCSSFVSRLYKKYFNLTLPETTDDYPGISYHVGSYGSVELQPGDVLYRSGHVEIYIGNGNRVGAHSSKIATSKQISVENSSGNFTDVYRFIR